MPTSWEMLENIFPLSRTWLSVEFSIFLFTAAAWMRVDKASTIQFLASFELNPEQNSLKIWLLLSWRHLAHRFKDWLSILGEIERETRWRLFKFLVQFHRLWRCWWNSHATVWQSPRNVFKCFIGTNIVILSEGWDERRQLELENDGPSHGEIKTAEKKQFQVLVLAGEM